MRKAISKEQIETRILQQAAIHPATAGLELWGGVYRCEPGSPGAANWNYACRYRHDRERSHGACESTIKAIVQRLREAYDLA
jgi:hypothetical protein